MSRSKITALGFCFLWLSAASLADEVRMKDGAVLQNIMIGDMGRRYLVVVIDRNQVLSVDFTSSNTKSAEAALKAYENSILKTNNAPAGDLVALVDKMVKKSQSRIKGRLLYKGEPAKGKPVAIRRITNEYSIGGLVLNPSNPELSGFYETLTDDEGYYTFHGVPAGKYDLLWKSRDGTGWIRRLSAKPDIVLNAANEHLDLKDTNIGKAPIN